MHRLENCFPALRQKEQKFNFERSCFVIDRKKLFTKILITEKASKLIFLCFKILKRQFSHLQIENQAHF